MRVRSRIWLIAGAAATTIAQPFRWLWRLLRAPVTVESAWVDTTNQQARSAVERFEALLDRKGHKALGLPTPPKDPNERRRWIIRMAHRSRG